MKTILPLLFFGVVAGSCLIGAAGRLPAFTVERWVNSTPLTVEALRGKVVLLDIWEYTCINWIRTSPYVKAGTATTPRSASSSLACMHQSSSSASAPTTSTVGSVTTG